VCKSREQVQLAVVVIWFLGLGSEFMLVIVGTRADPGFNAQDRTNKSLTTGPFDNTYEADEVSPKVEAGVVVGLKHLQP
jgi:hypothetical protein